MSNETRTYLQLIEAANMADTIALAFETNGLDMDGADELYEDLCGIELEYVHSPKYVVDAPRDRVVVLLAVIIRAVRRVDAVYDAAMTVSAAHTRAALAAM